MTLVDPETGDSHLLKSDSCDRGEEDNKKFAYEKVFHQENIIINWKCRKNGASLWTLINQNERVC